MFIVIITNKCNKQENIIMLLVNKTDRKILKQQLQKETFKRRTISFYKYFEIENPQEFRDNLFIKWAELNCFGRIYIAREGINAQMSVPEHNLDIFSQHLYSISDLNQVPIKYAIEDDGKSFYKLTIKVRPKIVADGLEHGTYDLSKVGNHLTALEFHNALDDPDTVVVDMRNHYESEIGHFRNAFCPDVDTFREEIKLVVDKFQDEKDKKFLLYCTGGIRCEKASAFLINEGFQHVSQLYGGIIEYAQQIKQLGVASKFYGKNFVFDERLGESVDGQIISRCHQCGKPADTHTNCANDDCHLLFIQCDECREKYDGCCSDECKTIFHLPKEERIQFRAKNAQKYAESKIFKNRLRPRLKQKNV
ncbi:MAG: rhodanese-related sulfurtransferase [Paludibacter sp.]|nr:rhodanese-related sulfurtransferase [Paludibacter sp.]